MDEAYERHRESMRQQRAGQTLRGQDIGDIPEVLDAARRKAAESSFRWFCESYFPHTFLLAWSDDHLKVINRIETAVMEGGLFAVAMPRGSGKTSLAETACLWALLTVKREFVVLICSDEKSAVSMLDSLKSELESNDLLRDDFPEVCFPIQSMDGSARRCEGQRHNGGRTHISWKEKEIVLPTIAGSQASGGVVRVTGLTGHFRGMKFKRPDGKSARPDLVIVDDPQTDESAASPKQCADRERLLAGAVLGLAGPGKKISGIMPCTVIRPGDMADRLLDREKHPQWQGERTRMVYAFPDNEKLWDEYAEIRAESFRDGTAGRPATEFYRRCREAMDAGSRVAWPARFNPDDLSAIQHAMNLKFQDEAAFFAEYQNDPLADEEPDEDLLPVDQIAVKTNGHNRRLVPHDCSHLTVFIDVQQKMLFYAVVGWREDFTGYVIDYGAWPDQKRTQYTLRDAKITLAMKFPRSGLEGSLYAGLEKLTGELLGEWKRDDGAVVRVDRCLIDANWGVSTDVVYQFCRQSGHSAVLMPSHGRFVGASSIPFSEYKRKPGERTGHNWRIPNVRGKRAVRHVTYDTNYWKGVVQSRLAVSMGDRGCLSLYGKQPHRLFANHLVAEYRVRTEGRGRTVDEWKLRPEKPDNHWLDCLVGCAVAASIQGVRLAEAEAKAKRQTKSRQRMSLAQRRAKKRGAA